LLGTGIGEPFVSPPAPISRSKFSVIEIIKLRDGKYAEYWATADMFGLLQQIRLE